MEGAENGKRVILLSSIIGIKYLHCPFHLSYITDWSPELAMSAA